jgi:hypothetical protein
MYDERRSMSRQGLIAFVSGGIVIVVTFLMLIMPIWNVWAERLSGSAVAAKAEFARQVLVSQAHAERDAAELQAEAITIVGKAAKEYPEYRQQEFIRSFAHALEQGKIHQIVYVPTEANIPIIEATRLQKKPE